MRGINAGARELSRADLDALTELAKQHGAKGLVWAFVEREGWRSPTAKLRSATADPLRTTAQTLRARPTAACC